MKITRTFTPKKDTGNKVVFEEVPPQGQPIVMGSAYVAKNMLPTAQRTFASAQPITIEFTLPDEPQQASPAVPTATGPVKKK